MPRHRAASTRRSAPPRPGDTISLADGSYDLGKLTFPAMPLNWRPTDPNTRPVLTSSGAKPTIDVGSAQSGSAFEHLEIDHAPTGPLTSPDALRVEPGMTATVRSSVIKAPRCIFAPEAGQLTVQDSALTGLSTAPCLITDAQFSLRHSTVDRALEASSDPRFFLVFATGLLENSRIAGPVFLEGPTAVVRRTTVDGWFGVDGVGLVVDSLVKAHGTGEPAVTADSTDGSSALRVVNSTVISSGGPALLSNALKSQEGGPVGPNDLVVTNSIARGATVDLQGTSSVKCGDDQVCDLGLVHVDHTDFASRSPAAGDPGAGVIVEGAGNRKADPLFVDPLGGDYHLRPGSPAIDAGSAIAEALPADHDGLPRFQGRAPDLGAYEFPQASTAPGGGGPGSTGGPATAEAGATTQPAARPSALPRDRQANGNHDPVRARQVVQCHARVQARARRPPQVHPCRRPADLRRRPRRDQQGPLLRTRGRQAARTRQLPGERHPRGRPGAVGALRDRLTLGVDGPPRPRGRAVVGLRESHIRHGDACG